MRKIVTIYTIMMLFLPVLAQAQIEKIEKVKKGKEAKEVKKDTVALIDSLPQVYQLTMDIFRDSTWGREGLNMRMTKNTAKNGTIPKKFQSIDNVQVGDLICEYFNADASIVMREIMKSPLQTGQETTTFPLFVQREFKAVRLEVRYVRRDRKTERIGSFKLIKPTDF